MFRRFLENVLRFDMKCMHIKQLLNAFHFIWISSGTVELNIQVGSRDISSSLRSPLDTQYLWILYIVKSWARLEISCKTHFNWSLISTIIVTINWR